MTSWNHVGEGTIKDDDGELVGRFVGHSHKRDRLIMAVNNEAALRTRIAELEKENAALREAAADLSLWRVYVLAPKGPGQRRHDVRIYRVAATSRKHAIEQVRQQIIVDQEQAGHKIVDAAMFSTVNAVIYDGVFSLTPADLAKREYDTADL